MKMAEIKQMRTTAKGIAMDRDFAVLLAETEKELVEGRVELRV